MVIGALSGCGQSKTQKTDTALETEIAAEASEEETGYNEITQVRVAYMQNYASLWEVATAINKGYFEEQGLDIKLYAFQDGPTEINAMESGSIDVAYIGPGAHKLCIQGQASIFCFSHLGNADCVMGLKSHGVNSLKDLKGKKVAYASGTASETILKRALSSVGLTMDDIEAAGSPSSSTIVSELGDDAQIFCTNTTFADEAADCEGWVCMPGYVEANSDILVRFTKALYEAMDYGSQEANYDEVAGYVAEICGTDKAAALEQTGDGAWLDSKTLLKYLEDGTLKHYYEVQQKNFIDAGDIDKEVPVEDYVLFDIMEEADK